MYRMNAKVGNYLLLINLAHPKFKYLGFNFLGGFFFGWFLFCFVGEGGMLFGAFL